MNDKEILYPPIVRERPDGLWVMHVTRTPDEDDEASVVSRTDQFTMTPHVAAEFFRSVMSAVSRMLP